MSGPKLLLVGAGGHAQACIDVVECQGTYAIGGLVGATEELGTSVLGHLVIGTDADLKDLAEDFDHALVAVGQIGSPERRTALFAMLDQLGFGMPSIVSPLARVSRHAAIGRGTIVMHGAIVNAGGSVGSNCIINSNALIEHGATVQDHCHISTGAILNGGVRVGTGSFVGSGSVVREEVRIGRNCVVGMGLSVRHNIEDGSRFLGP